jgi:hypothetical protein
LFDKNDELLLKTEWSDLGRCRPHEIILEDDERIVGIRSRKSVGAEAYHYDF